MQVNNTKNNNLQIAVLGAGCAGLAAAMRLSKKGYRVFIFEQNANVGGLGRAEKKNGNIYEHGPHLFHTTDQEIFADIKAIAGGDIFPVKKTILIKFLGDYFAYPLSFRDVISKLPKKTIARAFFSFLFYKIKASVFIRKEKNSETELLRNYGKVVYDIFFKDYIKRVWGIRPSEFSPKFAQQRVPRLSLSGLFLKFHPGRKLNTSTADFVENTEGESYSTKKGFSVIAEKMLQEIEKCGGVIYRESEVVKLRRQENGKFKVGINSSKLQNNQEFEGVVSTIPINNLVGLLEPVMSTDARRSAGRLKFRPVVFVGLLVARKKVLPASILYFRELSFNRIIDLSYFGIEANPKDYTQLVAEITCSKDERFWTDDKHASESVIKELEAEGLIERNMIKDAHVFRAEYGYPVYTLGFEDSLKEIMGELDSYGNIKTAGRQGLFRYVNIHIAIKMGYEAADALEEKIKGRSC